MKSHKKESVEPAAEGRFVDDYLATLLARASWLVTHQFHAQVKALGIQPPVWRVLATLSEGDGVPVTELAKITLFQQPTLTKLIDRMARDGLVTRVADPTDGRRALVCITDAGRAAVSDLLARAKRHEAQVLAGYGAAETRQLKNTLRTLIERLGDEE